MPLPTSPCRRALVLALLAGALAVGLGAVLTLLLRAGGVDRRGPAPQDAPGPVLLVPGYGGNAGSLSALVRRLSDAGRDVTVVALPGDGTGDLQAQAAALDGAVRAALARTGAPSVDLVGYSAGGVVARPWVTGYDGRHRARRVVTLGSPHHGSRAAAVAGAVVPGACSAACQQLTPGSRLLTDLNRGDETPDGCLDVGMDDHRRDGHPAGDGPPRRRARRTRQSVCGDRRLRHADLPRDPVVLGLVLRAVDGPPPQPVGPGECAGLRARGSA